MPIITHIVNTTKELWNQGHLHRPASILVASCVKGYQRIHKGGWAFESCSNNDSKPSLPDSVGTKKDASGWFWGFSFLWNCYGCGWLWLQQWGEDWRNYDKRIPPMDPGNELRATSPHRYPLEMHQYPLGTGVLHGIHWRRAGIHWIPESGVGGRFPLIPFLLLPPNNKGSLKPEAFVLYCLHPHS